MNNSSALAFRACLLNVFFLVAVASNVVEAKKDPIDITRVGLDKKSFNPSKGERAALSFEITRQASAQIVIYNRLGQEVESFDMPEIEAGRHSIKWDGCDANGKLAAGDIFLYVIEVKTKDGKAITYNPAEKTGGFEVKPLEYTLDKETGEIEYVLPKACMIRLRAGLKDGFLARTIFDWEPRTPGRHRCQWDGKDGSGLINILKHPELDLRLTCYTLPANTIITKGTELPFESKNNPHRRQDYEREQLWATGEKYRHYKHNPRICHEPGFKILFPDKDRVTESGIPVVSGIVPIRIELDPRDAKHLVNKRFEIMVYVNGIFIHEVEEGSSPFTFHWDTKAFKKGSHTITVNVLSYDDHIGIVSRGIIIGD